MERFVYPPLPTGRYTRLIQLQPSSDRRKPLCCKIMTVNLDEDNDTYEAISYTWGPPTFSETLVVHDEAENAYSLRITPTLSSALLRFRSAWNQRLLWADAVCINQADNADKGRQIPIMSQIYGSALRVLVWLGDSTQAVKELKAFIRLPRQLRQVRDEIARNRKGLGNSERDPGGHEEGQFLNAIISVVRAMCGQRWFSRRWIIQEVVFNPDVVLHCGWEKISWTSFMFILQDFLALELPEGYQSMSSLTTFSSLVRMSDLRDMHALRATNVSRTESSLFSLLEHFEHFGCADPRDRIFALAVMAGNVDIQPSIPGNPAIFSSPSGFVINTNNQVNAIELYTAFAGAIYASTEHDAGLQYVLSQASSRRNRATMAGLPGLPSWVPDWSLPPHLKMLHFNSHTHRGVADGLGKIRGTAKKQPPTSAEMFCLTANVKIITSKTTPLKGAGLLANQPGRSRCLTTMKVTWVGPTFPDDPTASSAQWLVDSARQLWRRDEMRGDMGDPENSELRDGFIWILTEALFDMASPEILGFPNDVLDLETLTYHDPEFSVYSQPSRGSESEDLRETFAAAIEEFLKGILQKAASGERFPDLSRDPVFHWIETTMKGRAFFTADRNFGCNGLNSTPVVIIGIGPSDAAPGDGVLAFNEHFWQPRLDVPFLGFNFGLARLERKIDSVDVSDLDRMDGYEDEVRDSVVPSTTESNPQPSASSRTSTTDSKPPKSWRQLFGSWETLFDMTYLVRVVNQNGSQQDLQEGLCWTLDDADEELSRSQKVGYELVGECRCAGTIFGPEEEGPFVESSKGNNVYACKAHDDQGTHYRIIWGIECEPVTISFV